MDIKSRTKKLVAMANKSGWEPDGETTHGLVREFPSKADATSASALFEREGFTVSVTDDRNNQDDLTARRWWVWVA